MEKKVSLQKIINMVLEDKQPPSDGNFDFEKHGRRIRRAFDRLLERLGTNKEALKNSGDTIEFDELEIPFMKALLSKLYDKSGMIAEFANDRSGGRRFSSQDVLDFIEALSAEFADEGLDQEDLWYMKQFFEGLFLYSPLRSLETCHALIDGLADNLQDLSTDEQSWYLGELEHILKKEVALRMAESAYNSKLIAMGAEKWSVLSGGNAGYYYEKDDEIRLHYILRDKQVLKKIQEDDDLRQYIEKRLGKKAEEIFNYATLEK